MNAVRGFERIVAIALGLSVACIARAQYSGGTGEPNDPYRIATAADIVALCQRERDHYDKHFVLTADIDLSGCPADQYHCIASFSGVFDGDGHTISNFTSYDVGLFGFIRNSSTLIKNLGLVDPNVRAKKGGVGGLVGYLWEGTVQDCYVSGGRIAGPDTVGGLVGCTRLAGKIIGCHSTAAVSGWSVVGGLVGMNGGTMSQCYSVATVSCDFSAAGGLVGRNGVSLATGGDEAGRIRYCYSGGTVQGNWSVGGLVGYNEYSSIADCYSTADVTGNFAVGGLAGEQNFGSIVCAYAVGRVTGDERAGGLVSSPGAPSAGRRIGTGGVSVGSEERNIVVASFWDTETSGQTDGGGGMGKTTAEMHTARIFLGAGWDFVGETANGSEDVWWIDEGKDYPRLRWERQEPARLPVVELDAAGFDAAIARGVVLVEFFATWCSACSRQAPLLEEVATRLEGRAQVAKLDVDKAGGIVGRYGVTAVPTLILFREGGEVKRFVGVTSADVLLAAILEAADSP